MRRVERAAEQAHALARRQRKAAAERARAIDGRARGGPGEPHSAGLPQGRQAPDSAPDSPRPRPRLQPRARLRPRRRGGPSPARKPHAAARAPPRPTRPRPAWASRPRPVRARRPSRPASRDRARRPCSAPGSPACRPARRRRLRARRARCARPRPTSSWVASTRWISTAVRSTWPRNLRAQARAFRGAFDQAGDVGQHEALAHRQVDHAEVGGQGRERIVGDLGRGGGGRGQEGRLAGVGQAHEADVGDQLQPQPEPLLLALLARDWRSAAPG